MNIATILNHIDSGYMALPEFQRGYVWNRDQVRGLFDSLYRRHPVGGLLVWVTESDSAVYRGEGELAKGVVKLLLDGQQRITTLYGIARGRPPKFFEGAKSTLEGLRFHLETEEFSFWQPVKMRDDPLWIDLSRLFEKGMTGVGEMAMRMQTDSNAATNLGKYVERLSRLLAILEIDLHVEEVTGPDKTIDVVVDIFNRVNSGGTKLSKGDLALAKICSDWPEARETMKGHLDRWEEAGYHFNYDWLLRSVNTVLTGEAKFQFLHAKSAIEVQEALTRATKHIDSILNAISGRLGLDHDRVLFGRFAIPVMVSYLDRMNGVWSAVSRDRLLFWFAQAGMWGRYSASTESMIDQDLAALDRPGDPLDNLLQQLRLWQGSFSVEPDHFGGSSLGARFYPVLYLLTRLGEARDWGSGLPLKGDLLGKGSRLEVHHIFPKSLLYDRGMGRGDVNSLANFCFLTKDTNLHITNREPAEYFREVEAQHPGALASQWIPKDTELWKLENYREFLAARRTLLAAEANLRLKELLHGEDHWYGREEISAHTFVVPVPGATSGPDEEAELDHLNEWVVGAGLPSGELSYEVVESESGEPLAALDLAWPDGLQEGLSQPVAVLLNEGPETLAAASAVGFRCFTNAAAFKSYVEREVLGVGNFGPGAQRGSSPQA